MDLLQVVLKHYHLSNATMGRNNTIRADEGLKRIYFWENEVLLEWHVSWREGCKSNPSVTPNRMIRTKKNDTAVKCEKGWLTLHDEVAALSPMKGQEKLWGSMLGQMIGFGLNSDIKVESSSYQFPEQLEPVDERARGKLRDNQQKLIRLCHQEAVKRIEKAKSIQLYCKDAALPLLDPINKNHARQIYHLLFWQGTDEVPERGYYNMHQFLLRWYEENGEDSLFDLLDSIENASQLDEKQCYHLLVQCMLPYEYITLNKKLKTVQTDLEIERHFLTFQRKWDLRSKLVLNFSNWLDTQRKKVAK